MTVSARAAGYGHGPDRQALRVLHAIPSLESEYGGPTTIIRTLLPLLARMGVRSEVVTTSEELGLRAGVVSTFDPELDALVHRFPRRHMAGWRYAHGLRPWLRQEIRRFDLVHARSLYNFLSLAVCRAAEEENIPRLFEPQGSVSGWSRSFKAYKKVPYLRLVERGVVRRSEGALVTHAVERADLQGVMTESRPRIYRIPPPVECPVTSPAKQPGEELLFLGRLHPKKGLDLLMQAYADVAKECGDLSVAGTGESGYMEELRAQVECLGLDGRVRFLGHVEGVAKERAFSRAGLFVLPSHDENFGISVVESVARGIPVVASDAVAAALDLAEDGYARLFPSGDRGALAVTLAAAWRDHDWRRSVRDGGPGYVRSCYRPQIFAERVLGTYRELVDATGDAG